MKGRQARGTIPAGWLILAVITLAGAAGTAKAQTYNVLYSFQCGTDGSNPYGSVVRDASGNLYGTTYLGGTFGDGVVFKLTPGGVLSALHNFAGSPTDGINPVATMVLGGAGNMYGTTGKGGLNNFGTVFKVTPGGSETVLHSFANGTSDGVYPYPSLILDAAGNIYGTTVLGGAHQAGTAFKLTQGGTETILYSFGASASDGQHPHAGLFRDATGNFFGTTLDGGTFGDGTIFRLTPTGTEAVLHNFPAFSGDGEHPHTLLVRDSAGNFYGTTLDGGAQNRGTIFELAAGGHETVLHSFAGSPTDGQRPHVGLVRDPAGNLFGTTLDGGAFTFGTVFELTSAGTESVLHSFANDATDGGTPQNGLARDSAGNLYGTTYYGGASGCGTVFEYTP